MKNNECLFDRITIMKSNPHYRLGDIILQIGPRWKHDRDIIKTGDVYKNTILRTYLDHKKTTIKIDRMCLSHVIRQFSENIKTDENTLYVHLRLGDIVMNWDGNLSKPNSVGRRRRVFLYNNSRLIQQIRRTLDNNNDINHIKIVTSLHFGDNKIHGGFFHTQEAVRENQILFDRIIENITTKFNQSISVHTNQSAGQLQLIDQHTLILSCCKHAICDNGGFGRVIKLIRKVI